MYDPLTPVEFEQFLQNFRKTFVELYQQALKSGALEPQQEHDHTLARCILIISAFKYESGKSEKMRKNVEKFI